MRSLRRSKRSWTSRRMRRWTWRLPSSSPPRPSLLPRRLSAQQSDRADPLFAAAGDQPAREARPSLGAFPIRAGFSVSITEFYL